MKKISKYTLCFIISFFVNKANAQTTAQEYNYVSFGLLDNLSKGQDIKDGYKIESTGISEKITRGDGSWRNAEIYYFKKKSTNKIQAYAVECTGNDGSRRFMCIPTNDASSSIWDKTWQEFNGTGCEWYSVFMWTLIKLSAKKIS